MKTADKLHVNARGGFTLVEVMVSMGLMAIVFTSSYATYFLGMNLVEDAREELRASQIVQSELERMRTLTWVDMEGSIGTQKVTPQGNFVKNFSKDYTVYRSVRQISSTQNSVVLYVYWQNSRGDRSAQLFNTVFTKNGMNDYYYTTPAAN